MGSAVCFRGATWPRDSSKRTKRTSGQTGLLWRVWSEEHIFLLLCSLVEGFEPGCSQMTGSPLVEDPPQRLRWQAHLEFTHNHDVGDLTWDKIAVSLPRSEKLRSLVLAGIPHGMRPQVRCPQRQGSPRGLRVPWSVTRQTAT